MRLFLILISLVVTIKAYAQIGNFVNYTVRDGLPSNAVYCAVQDNRGFIWFGTGAGLSRFDGVEFKNFTINDGLPENDIINLYLDTRGRIWVYTISGKVGFISNDEIHTSNDLDYLVPLDGKSQITNIFEKDSVIYISGHDIKRLDHNNESSKIPINDKTKYAYAVPLNDSVLIVDVNELRKERNGAVGPSKQYFVANKASTNHKIYHHYLDDQILYFSNLSGKLGYLDLSNDSLHFITNIQQVLNLKAVDDQPFIFLQDGVYLLNTLGNSLGSKLFEIDGACNYFRDNDNNEWITSISTGVWLKKGDVEKLKYYSPSFTSATLIDSQSKLLLHQRNEIWEIDPFSGLRVREKFSDPFYMKTIYKDDEGNLAIAKRLGYYYKGKEHSVISFNEIYESEEGLTVITPRSIFFLDSFSDIEILENIEYRRSNGKIRFYDSKITDFHQFSRDSILIGTTKGLYRLTKDTAEYLGNHHSVLRESISELAYSEDGSIWIGTDAGKLVRYSKDSLLVLEAGKDISGQIFNGIVVHKNVTWVGTNAGLNIISSRGIQKVTEEDGLPSDYILDLEELNDSIYVSTEGGLISLHSNTTFEESNHIPIFIEEVLANQKPVDVSEELELSHKVTVIEFKFSGISYTETQSLKFRYQFKPKDHENDIWRETTERQAFFVNQSPGTYIFLLQAKTKNSDWSPPKKVTITILTPIWQTWWFQLCVASFLLLAAGTVIWRIRKAKRFREKLDRDKIEAQIKALKAQINPHFLFNALSSIQRFMMKDKKDLAEDYLADYGRLIRKVLDQSDKLTITLQEELETLRLYTEIEQLRTNDQFVTHFEVDKSIDPYTTKIPAMIIQPLLENAIWHGIRPLKKKGEIIIVIGFDRTGRVNVKIADNGVGFETGNSVTNYESYGSKLVKERLELLRRFYKKDFQFQINSTPGEGTLINIKFPSNL